MRIPEGWKKIHLDKVAKIQTGVAKNSKAIGDCVSLPYLRVANVQDGHLDLSEVKLINLPKDKVGRFQLEKGDVLLTEGGDFDKLGRGTIWNDEIKNCVHQNHVFVARPNNKKLLSAFLTAQTSSPYGKKYFLRCSKQSTNLASINSTQLKAFPVLLPPLPEQKAIAEILETWDAAIEKTERLIDAKQKSLTQYTKLLLFGDRRLSKHTAEPMVGHFFNYPSDWMVVSIGEIAEEVIKRNNNQDRTVLSCSKHEGFVNSLDYFGKQIFSNDTSNYKVIKNDQFGYPANHIEEGSIGLLQHCLEGIVSPIYVVFAVQQDKVNPQYLYKLLKTEIYRHIFEISTSASVDRRGSLRWKEFSKIKVLVPSLKEQNKIAETLDAAQREIDVLKKLVEKYKTQKRGLMQKLLTGEWRVSSGTSAEV